jgi:hypothetical protein
VTISFRTHHIPVQEKPDVIKLDNLLKSAEGQVMGTGARPAEVRRFLEPIRELLSPMNDAFWQHQSQGLAIFRSTGSFDYFRLSYPVQEMLFVSDHFQLKPLLPLLSGSGQFYLLGLGSREVVLYRGSRYELDRIDADSLPVTLATPLRANRIGEILLARGSISTGMIPEPPVRSGPDLSGGKTQGDVARNDLLTYFQQIRSGINDFLAGERLPLVLAGADYLPFLYREVNAYAHLAGDVVAADPSNMTEEDLHKRAWSIVGPRFEQARKDAVERYKPLAKTPGASHDIDEIASAAFFGKVEVLFVSSVTEYWGRFDERDGKVAPEKQAGAGVVDLLDFAAAHTSLKGGTTYVLPPEQIPNAGPAAAIYRY